MGSILRAVFWIGIYLGFGAVMHLIFVGSEIRLNSAWSLAVIGAWPVFAVLVAGVVALIIWAIVAMARSIR
jgi:hypothetical protein